MSQISLSLIAQNYNNIRWSPRWDLQMAIEKVVEWTKCWSSNGEVRDCMNKLIEEFLNENPSDK